MCAIVGFFGKEDVVFDLLSGLLALQHRGQDAAGIVTFDKTFRMKKGLGLVNNVFEKKHLKRLKGPIGIGHTRYTTQGTNDLSNAQPFTINYPFGLSMVHNGNVVNFKELRNELYEERQILLETSNDLELILYTFATELAKNDLKNLQVKDIFDAVERLQLKVKGAYSTITIIANRGLLAFTDAFGIRPVVMGKKETEEGTVYAFASESACFDYLGYEMIGDLNAGEAVFIDMEGNVHRRNGQQQSEKFCIFEYIYFADESSVIQNRLVASERVRMGRMLGKKIKEAGLQPDIVIDVPSSGYFAASGLAEVLEVPYRRGFSKNSHIGRSFISPSQKEREKMVKRKLNPIKQVVEGKKVAVVDDSIVRGTTSKRIVQILREAGAKEVYFISAAPPIKYPCIYGIDMAVSTDLIASKKTLQEITEAIEADAVIYQSLEDLKSLYKDFNFCNACFSGEYPVGGSKKYLKQIRKEREFSQVK
ncbi:MAG: amidophosphoribosyltransferase [Chitinophagales bacterium]